MDFIIGIDGGGTETRAVLADDIGHIYADASSGSSNPNAVSEPALRATFKELFKKLLKQTEEPITNVTTIFAGIAGSSSEENTSKLWRLIKEMVPDNVAVFIEIDAINALYSGTCGKSGIVQIAGTGSISYGINKDNQRDRVGGWGYLLGDEGSGFFIGQQAITASLKGYDGRCERTSFSKSIFDFFNVTTGEELIHSIYSSPSPKNQIATVTKHVYAAYRHNDPVAIDIIQEASKELSANIIALYHKLFHNETSIEAVLCGGIFDDTKVMPPLIAKEVKKQTKNVSIVLPEMPPVAGSVIGGMIKNSSWISEDVIMHLTSALGKN